MEDIGPVDRNELVTNIVAENAILKVRIKHEYDLACTIAADINKVESDIETCQRELKRCQEIYELKTTDYARLKEYLDNIRASKERVQNSIENLQRQHEMMLIEEEQCAKERDIVRANYEAMIRNQIDINNSYPIMVAKNKLQNELDSCRIQLAVLQTRRGDMLTKRWRLDEITNLRFQQAVVEFAKKYIEARNYYKKNLELDNLLKEKRKKLQELKETKSQSSIENSENENTSREKFNLGNTIRTLFPPAWRSPFPVAPKIPSMTFSKPDDTEKYIQQLNVLKKSQSSLTSTSSSLLLQSLPSKLESPFTQFQHDSKLELRETMTKPVKSIVSDVYRDDDADKETRNVNDDTVDKIDMEPLHDNTTNNEIENEKSVKSPSPKLLPEKLAAVELDTAENDVNPLSDEVTNRIGCMNLSQPDGETCKSSVSINTKNTHETVIENSPSPKSRIPVLIAKDLPRVTSSPYARSNMNSPKICSPKNSVAKSGEIPESSHVPAVKEVNTPKRANVESPKRIQKIAKIDHAFVQHMQARKPKQLLDATTEQDTSRHAACKVASASIKTGMNFPLKIFTQDRRTTVKSNAKMNLVNRESKSVLQLETKTMRDMRMDSRKQTLKGSNPKIKNVLDERGKNESVMAARAKKPVEITDLSNKFHGVASTNIVQNGDGKKPRAEMRKNKNLGGQNDEKSRVKTIKTPDGRGFEANNVESYGQKNKIDDANRSKYFTSEQSRDTRDSNNHQNTNNTEDPAYYNEDTYDDNCNDVDAIFTSISGNSNLNNNDNISFSFPGLNKTYTVQSPESDNSSVPSFRSTNTGFPEEMFEIGSSVADIFGTDYTKDNDQRDGFSFNFESQSDNKPFKLF